MATTYTDNLNLQQPDLDDDALITVINNDMAIIDQAVNGVQDGLAIVANGNTHVAISAGQFVYVRNHTTLTEGLYVASSNIAANATLSTSNLTADSAGGLNALNGKIATNTITVGQPAQSNFTINSCVGKRSGNVVQLIVTATCSTAATGWTTIASIADSDKCHTEIRQAIFAQDRTQESGSSAEFYLQVGRYLQILGGKTGCVYNINLVWLTT